MTRTLARDGAGGGHRGTRGVTRFRGLLGLCATLGAIACGATSAGNDPASGGDSEAGQSGAAAGASSPGASSTAGASSGGLGGPRVSSPSAYDTLLGCSIDEPCQPVRDDSAECPLLTVDNLECLVQHLRDRTPGRYRYASSSCSSIGTAGTYSVIIVHDDGRATSASCNSGFMGDITCGEMTRCSLPTAETLDACLATKSQWNAFLQPTCASLSGLLLSCMPVATTCD